MKKKNEKKKPFANVTGKLQNVRRKGQLKITDCLLFHQSNEKKNQTINLDEIEETKVLGEIDLNVVRQLDITKETNSIKSTNRNIIKKPNLKKKVESSVPKESNLIKTVDLNEIGKTNTDDLKKTFKNLKPENYRIQQVIKEEDLVHFDLETGGMGSKEDILQIGAINYEGKKFNMYATPTKPIPGMSSRIHHITFKDGQLCYRKNPVEHKSIIEVFLQFFDYLNQTRSEKIVLVAHNANFDRRFLIEKLFLYNLQYRLSEKVIGFLDTLPLFRQMMPAKPSYKLNKLILSHFPKLQTDFHNALTDVIYLKKLFDKVALSRMKKELKFINNYTQSTEYGILKKEQQLFEGLSKKRAFSKKEDNKNSIPISRKRKSIGIYINGEAVKRTRKTANSEPTRKSTRLNKKSITNIF